MNPDASVDLVAAEVGLLHYGGATRLYDLPDEEQIEALAIGLVRLAAPRLSIAPVTAAALVEIHNEIHGRGSKSGGLDLGSVLDAAVRQAG